MDSTRRVLIGITGGIAAYKVPLLVRILRKNGCEIKVALTNAAKTLVGIDALRTLSGSLVYLDADAGGGAEYDMGHIRLSEWADVFLICPATANTIAKIAGGIADNLLSTLALSIPEAKIIVAPAMNSVMWVNSATRANINTLVARGITVLPVETGELACGISGPGRMLGIDEIGRHVLSRFGVDKLSSCDNLSGGKSLCSNGLGEASFLLKGKTVLISSGPTEEPIDPVRVITNQSSGKMGAALAKAALSLGARVIVVSGPAAEPIPAGAEIVPVRTAAEMEREIGERFGSADICVMAAAVSDYRPINFSDAKMRRSESENITIELTPNPDILAGLGAVKSARQFLIGFALESENDIDRAAEKMKKKKCDMMVFNRVDAALGGDSTGFTIIYSDGKREGFSTMSKDEAARIIFSKINEIG